MKYAIFVKSKRVDFYQFFFPKNTQLQYRNSPLFLLFTLLISNFDFPKEIIIVKN